jgi:Protein of unknown function (DUF1566)
MILLTWGLRGYVRKFRLKILMILLTGILFSCEKGTHVFSYHYDNPYEVKEAPKIPFSPASSPGKQAATTTTAAQSTPVVIPGACDLEDANFKTEYGGCRDQITGLIWSARSPNKIAWVDAVWDLNAPGNSGSQKPSDYGRTSEFDPKGNVKVTYLNTSPQTVSQAYPATYDKTVMPPVPSTKSYCHSLNEANHTDWRLPTANEIHTLYSHQTSKINLNKQSGISYFWSSTIANNQTTPMLNISLELGTHGTSDLGYGMYSSDTSYQLYTYCIRGDARGTLYGLNGRSYPNAIGKNTPPQTGKGFAIGVTDNNGFAVPVEGISVSVTSNMSTISGTSAVLTDKFGVAYFEAFTLDTPGNNTLTFTATGLASTQINVTVGAFPQTCLVEDDAFSTAFGGCHDSVDHVSWSLPRTGKISWYDTIWGYVAASFNQADPPRSSDGAHTSDYFGFDATYTYGYPDISTVNYCHDLTEGGFTDWRVPTILELDNLYSHGGSTHVMRYNDYDYYWSAATQPLVGQNAWQVSTTVGDQYQTVDKNSTSTAGTICVRSAW